MYEVMILIYIASLKNICCQIFKEMDKIRIMEFHQPPPPPSPFSLMTPHTQTTKNKWNSELCNTKAIISKAHYIQKLYNIGWHWGLYENILHASWMIFTEPVGELNIIHDKYISSKYKNGQVSSKIRNFLKFPSKIVTKHILLGIVAERTSFCVR